jgi:pimeloyl-ACP methyl ester carboxylesterase
MTQISTSDGMTFEYEAFGDAADPPLLLVMGFGAQLIAWPRAFCERLAAGGRYVVAFDNRDCGLSSKLDGEVVDLEGVIAAASAGDMDGARRLAPYTLSAMAADAFALLTALGIERAHVVGTSVGGMIAQIMAIERPERVLTLTSMMSSTGEPSFGQSTPEAMAALFAAAPTDRAGAIAAASHARVWASKRYLDVEALEELAAQSYDRSFYPEGLRRQLAAMISSGSRADGLRDLATPTLVIHGLDDTLITPSGGERTAALIPGARLLLIEDMGHDRPEPLWDRICGAILEHTM